MLFKYMCFCNKKCDWCKKRKPDTVQFKGYHKYTGMIICQECFDMMNQDATFAEENGSG